MRDRVREGRRRGTEGANDQDLGFQMRPECFEWGQSFEWVEGGAKRGRERASGFGSGLKDPALRQTMRERTHIKQGVVGGGSLKHVS